MSPLEKILRLLNGCVSVASYLKARFAEKSTYGGIVLAIGGGAGFSSPWNYLAVLAGITGVLVPDQGGTK